MSKQYLENELNKIFTDTTRSSALNKAMAAGFIALNYKGHDVKVLDVSKVTTLAEYFVLVSVDGAIQGKAIMEDLASQIKNFTTDKATIEGLDSEQWILLDSSDVLVHIFQESSRLVYNLDELWKEAPSISLPEYFYTSSAHQDNEGPESSNDQDRKYF